MELAVLIRPFGTNGFRASSGDPFPATADGATRDEALDNLRTALVAQVGGAELVRLRVPLAPPSGPVWPDDEITQDWLAGIAAARQAADARPDPGDADPS